MSIADRMPKELHICLHGWEDGPLDLHEKDGSPSLAKKVRMYTDNGEAIIYSEYPFSANGLDYDSEPWQRIGVKEYNKEKEKDDSLYFVVCIPHEDGSKSYWSWRIPTKIHYGRLVLELRGDLNEAQALEVIRSLGHPEYVKSIRLDPHTILVLTEDETYTP